VSDPIFTQGQRVRSQHGHTGTVIEIANGKRLPYLVRFDTDPDREHWHPGWYLDAVEPEPAHSLTPASQGGRPVNRAVHAVGTITAIALLAGTYITTAAGHPAIGAALTVTGIIVIAANTQDPR